MFRFAYNELCVCLLIWVYLPWSRVVWVFEFLVGLFCLVVWFVGFLGVLVVIYLIDIYWF